MVHKYGSMAVGSMAGLPVPDATCAFRAMTREAALRTNIVSDYSHTHESLVQAGSHRLTVKSVPVTINETPHLATVFSPTDSAITRGATTILQTYTSNYPLKFFLRLSLPFLLGALAIFGRFLWYYPTEGSSGHVQSLILGAVLFTVSASLVTVGLVADLVNANRKLLEEVLRLKRDRGVQ